MKLMPRALGASVAIALMVAFVPSAPAQPSRAAIRIPSAEKVLDAKRMAIDLFAKLKEGKTDDVAQWIVREVGYSWSAQDKAKKTGEFKSSLDLILLGPPDGSVGKLDSFDLIQESYLPGSDRYFRLTYMTYHEVSPLLWEFRFYLTPEGKLTLHQIAWTPENPFDYLTKSELLFNKWYDQ
jgi:hypothetical protein